MRALVDTHALYRFIEGDGRLSEAALDAIADPDNEILISPASYWEMAIKISLRKWPLNRPYQGFMDVALVQYAFSILPISPTVTGTASATLRPRKQLHAQPLSHENHHRDNGYGGDQGQNHRQRIMPPPWRIGWPVPWHRAGWQVHH